MPRDGSNVYHLPPGTLGVPDTTIESNKYNSFVLDAQQEANTPRPIVAGGTGATTPDTALAALSGEKASQIVTNFDSYAFLSGSFIAAAGATGAPVAGNAFSGIAYVTDANNAAVEARDMTDAAHILYVRVKLAGVWSAWSSDNASIYVNKTGDSMSGLLTLSGDPTAAMQAATKQYVDASSASSLVVAPTAPAAARDSTLWWESDSGLLYIRYNDGNSTQWVLACPQPDITSFLMTSGSTMTGSLILAHDPVQPMEAATKQYVDGKNVRAGTIRFTICNVADTGWRLFDDGTVGNVGSGATYAAADAINLFNLMFANFGDVQAPLLSSGGVIITRASAGNNAAAWSANCRMSLPKTLGRALGVAGAGGGLTARQLGDIFGEEAHTMSKSEMPTHTHGGITGDDTPDHTHGVSEYILASTGSPGGGNWLVLQTPSNINTSGASTRHHHNIPSDGNGAPFNVMSPTAFLNAEIKL